jgi:hypothetical protein
MILLLNCKKAPAANSGPRVKQAAQDPEARRGAAKALSEMCKQFVAAAEVLLARF